MSDLGGAFDTREQGRISLGLLSVIHSLPVGFEPKLGAEVAIWGPSLPEELFLIFSLLSELQVFGFGVP